MAGPSASPEHAALWESLVGKAILRFGDIELVLIKCLEVIPADTIAESTARLGFSQRAELLIEILEARTDRTPDLNQLLECLKRAKPLANKRNLIAHNPVMLDIFVNEDETQMVAEHSISHARSGETMSLEDLKEFAATVEDLSSELWLTFLRLADSADPLWRKRRRDRA
jgi:hypothetical protein